MWYFLIGLFVRSAAQASYQQTLMREILHDVPVAQLMTKKPVTVEPSLLLDELVNKFFYTHNFKAFPVVEGSRLLGYVNLRDVRQVPRDQWQKCVVRDIMEDCSEQNTVDPGIDAASALTHMLRSRMPRVLVAKANHLAGVVSQSDILRFLAIRMNLEGETGGTLGSGLNSTP
jgi:predicted transcriptional regulator